VVLRPGDSPSQVETEVQVNPAVLRDPAPPSWTPALLLSALPCVFLWACSARSGGSPEPGAAPEIAALNAPSHARDFPRPTAPERQGTPRNPWSDPAREILAAHCGKCHRGDLSTAVPGALAVFNLVEEPWYARLRAEQFDALLVRTRGIKDMSPADAQAMISFVRCAREHRCKTDENENR